MRNRREPLWSEAYDADSSQVVVERSAPPLPSTPRPESDARVRSLTPTLDQLLGEPGSVGAIGAQPPTAAPRNLQHHTFFENPPMVSTSKGGYEDDHARRRRRGRTHDDDPADLYRSPCGHVGICSCADADPVPEPGSLLLAAAATAAAWGARRRARRRSRTGN